MCCSHRRKYENHTSYSFKLKQTYHVTNFMGRLESTSSVVSWDGLLVQLESGLIFQLL
jgi:hypothetical protein